MPTPNKSASTVPGSQADDRQSRLVNAIHAAVTALLDALKEQNAEEIEQQVWALESQCAAVSAMRHRERARQAQPATAEDTRDTLLNAVAEVRGTLRLAKLFLAKLRRSNAVMSQVHAVAEGAYSMRESRAGLRQ